MKFLGIPYTDLMNDVQRWKTQKLANVSIENVSNYGAISPQIPVKNDLLMGNVPLPPQHENCLNLNIFTTDTKANLPVMVWIHGGGFTIGSGSLPIYDGDELATKENVVVVTINYRLGALGFLRLCDVTDGVIPSNGNEGLDDQVTALKWIQENIHTFGGDKNNVTVFGESAGAMSISCLLAMPSAKGLFHKAILQSGAGHTYLTKDKANQVALAFIESAEALGFSTEQLLSISSDDILNIQKHLLARPEIYRDFGILPFRPVVDGEILPLPPHQAIAEGAAKEIIIIAGSNTEEWTLFAAIINQNIQDEEQLHLHLSPLIAKENITPYLALMSAQLNQRKTEITHQGLLNEALTEYWFSEPCNRLLAAHSQAGGTAYRYKLGRKTIIPTLGCTHITDIGLVFNHVAEQFHGSETRVLELAEEMQNCWGSFAHYGRPTSGDIEWPCYVDNMNSISEQKQQEFLFFDHHSTHLQTVSKQSTEFWLCISDEQLASF
ncbi:MAG: para-nitrobenzyl esterase [Alteromonadaceae bacterium]|jgi:para-nitrobenzyl esterase